MKSEMRKQVKQKLANLSDEEIASKSLQACHLLAETPEFRQARTVMAYLAMGGELDLSAAIVTAWRHDKTVLVPRIDWAERHMVAVELHSLDNGLEENSYGILEPEQTWPHPANEIDLVLVPGLAFDANGGRLGRGGGYYDRFLSLPTFAGTTCAVAFHEQLLESVPVEDHDRQVDMLVTDQEALRFDTSPA